jgi:hypothetical protein
MVAGSENSGPLGVPRMLNFWNAAGCPASLFARSNAALSD